MSSDRLSTVLGTAPITINVPKKTQPSDSDERFEEVQQNIRSVTEVGEMAMQELAQLVGQSQMPRGYEVLSTLMGQIVTANKTLLEIEKLKLEIEEKKRGDPAEPTKNVTNNLFVGSTAELLKQIRGKTDDE